MPDNSKAVNEQYPTPKQALETKLKVSDPASHGNGVLDNNKLILLFRYFHSYYIANFWKILLVLLSAITFHRWFSDGIFTYADWHYYDKNSLIEFFNTETWVSKYNIGNADATIWRYPFYFLIGGLGYLGISFSYIDKLLIFLPIVFLVPTSGYELLRSFDISKKGSFLGGLIFTFNTYFLAIMTQGHILLNLGFAFSTFAFIYFKKALSENSFLFFIYSNILLTISGFIDFRCVYITLFIIALFCILNISSVIKSKLNIILYFINIILLNLFWVIPFFLSKNSFSSDVLDRNLFGNPFWRLNYAITLTHPFWTQNKIYWFISQPINPIYWFTPLLAFLGLVVLLYHKKFKNFIFLLLIGFIGVILSKQSDYPFSELYIYLYKKLPGFNAFREATKFYFLIIFAYSIFIGYLFDFLLNSKKNLLIKIAKYICVSVVIFMTFLNSFPYLNGQIETIIEKRQIPLEYSELNKYLDSQPAFFRTLWIPLQSKWISETRSKPKISLTDLITNLLTGIHDSNEIEDYNLTKNYTFTNIIDSNYFENLLKQYSVKYVIVPIRDVANDDDFFSYFGNNRSELVNSLDNKQFLTPITLFNSGFKIYEIKNFNNEFTVKSNPIISLENSSNFESKFDFTTKELNIQNPDFVDLSDPQNKDKAIPQNSIKLIDPFENINSKDILSDTKKIQSKVNIGGFNKLYISKYNYDLRVIQKDDEMQFYLDASSPSFTEVSGEESKKTLLKSVDLMPDLEYYIQYDNLIFKIINGVELSLGVYNPDVNLTIMSSEGENLVSNGDFENGLWQSEVGDCNEFEKIDRQKYLSSQIVNHSNDKSSSLQIEAKIHAACEQKTLELKELSYYFFSYDYKALGLGSFSSFNLGFTDTYNKKNIENSNLNIKERSFINDNEWNTYSKLFLNPENNKKLEITLYAEATDKPNSVLYDNVKLLKLNTFQILDFESIPGNFKTINTSSIRSESLEYLKQFDIRNNIQNGDFENGLWQQSVSDCNNYDSKPEINMALGTSTNPDNKYLELSAKYHLACTFQDFSFYPGSKKFLLEFNYNTDADYIGYFISFNDTANTLIKSNLPVLEKDKSKWLNYLKDLPIPPNATRAVFGFYGYPGTFTARQNTGISKYDDIKLINLPDIYSKSYLVKGDLSKINNYEFTANDLNSQTFSSNRSYQAKIPSIANNIVFNSKYDPNWKLTKFEKNEHLKSVYSTNIWTVDQNNPANFDQFELSFLPQTRFNTLLPISFTYFYILIVLAFIYKYYKSKNKQNEQYPTPKQG